MAHAALTAKQWRDVRYVADFLGLSQLPPILLKFDNHGSQGHYDTQAKTIHISHRVQDTMLVQVIIHELRHHWQCLHGYVEYTYLGYLWLGKPHDFGDRFTRPWEIDAETFEYNMSLHLKLTPYRVAEGSHYIPPKRNLGQLLKVAA